VFIVAQGLLDKGILGEYICDVFGRLQVFFLLVIKKKSTGNNLPERMIVAECDGNILTWAVTVRMNRSILKNPVITFEFFGRKKASWAKMNAGRRKIS
jgi:hypothetical protein